MICILNTNYVHLSRTMICIGNTNYVCMSRTTCGMTHDMYLYMICIRNTNFVHLSRTTCDMTHIWTGRRPIPCRRYVPVTNYDMHTKYELRISVTNYMWHDSHVNRKGANPLQTICIWHVYESWVTNFIHLSRTMYDMTHITNRRRRPTPCKRYLYI